MDDSAQQIKSTESNTLIPPVFEQWFEQNQWQIRDYQKAMVHAFNSRKDTLLIAPTGAGKTLAGLLPTLINCYQFPQQGLHTLYISPLKALTNDIARNLLNPIEQMELAITVETRTGDTPSHKRQRQRRKPPNILLTTPESLMLMLSYADAPDLFKHLQSIVIDETHSLAGSKRGDFTSLALARLSSLAPQIIRFGLSATVAKPPLLAEWLGGAKQAANIIYAPNLVKPSIQILASDHYMPYSGFSARYAVADIYQEISLAKTTLVFVNTRAQAEMMFQHLWEVNEQGLAIAIYHGSLDKEQRRKTESLMAENRLRAVVTTSALELGIDWGDVDLVIQIGAPKGVSRLLQRIGRSNHRLDEPSRALLVPANRFEAIECQSAIDAIDRGELDGDPHEKGSLDIIPQYLINCGCSSAFDKDTIYNEIISTRPYQTLDKPSFDALLNFAINGGYALQAYDRFQRLEEIDSGKYQVLSRQVAMRHRRNIGTIVEAARLKVKRLRRKHEGKIIGEVEEYFAQQLSPGDSFVLAGEVLSFEGIKDMILEARPVKSGSPKVPAFVGGQMPLSTFLADAARDLLNTPSRWNTLPAQVIDWLTLQQAFSTIPNKTHLLVEHFIYRQLPFTVFYTFEGRKVNQTMGMLLTRRMETLGLKPISFSINDYALSICSAKSLGASDIEKIIAPDILGLELEEWIAESPMLKRAFRQVATVSGLTEQQFGGTKKTVKQMTVSTNLIYDVLRRYDPEHILLRATREDAERELLDLQRLSDYLWRFHGKIQFMPLEKVSPLGVSVVLNVRNEQIKGSGMDALLQQASIQDEADALIDDVKAFIKSVDAKN